MSHYDFQFTGCKEINSKIMRKTLEQDKMEDQKKLVEIPNNNCNINDL